MQNRGSVSNLVITVVVLAVLAAALLLVPRFINNRQAEDMDTNNTDDVSDEVASEENSKVVVTTNRGEFTLELFEKEAPITAGNFKKLVEEGFYDGIKFHRVISGFMVQAGDPNTKDDTLMDVWGTGGPGYTIEDEFAEGLSNTRGTISMANIGQPNSGGSQFFINLGDNSGLDFDKDPLTSKHPVFGRVVTGMDVIDAIASVQTEGPDRPVDPVVIESVTYQ